MKNKLMGLMFAIALGWTFALFGLLVSSQPMMAAPTRVGPQRQSDLITVTVMLTPTKDNTLYESTTGDVSNGAGAFFFVGNTAGTWAS